MKTANFGNYALESFKEKKSDGLDKSDRLDRSDKSDWSDKSEKSDPSDSVGLYFFKNLPSFGRAELKV